MEYAIYFQKCARMLHIFTAFWWIGFVAFPVQAESPSPEELLQMAEELSDKTFQMAIKAKETRDYYQAQHAFALASEAASWAFEVLGAAQEASNPELAQAAQDAVKRIRTAIGLARDAAREIAASNPEPDLAQAVNFLMETCDLLMRQLSLQTTQCLCINNAS